MIPTIEQIIEDVIAGTITKSQAINWLYQHAEGSANELRDHFAGLAMQGGVKWNKEHGDEFGYIPAYDVANGAYRYADAMIKRRAK